jgi:hypothetical protein
MSKVEGAVVNGLVYAKHMRSGYVLLFLVLEIALFEGVNIC